MNEEKSFGISVIIPTMNREPYCVQTIQDLLVQYHDHFEIIIVDQTDIPSEELKKLVVENPGKIRYIHSTIKGLPIARNTGWKNSQFDIVLYIDDDIRCGPEFLSEHVKALISSGAGIIAGGVENPNQKYSDKVTGKYYQVTGYCSGGFYLKNPGWVDLAPGGNASMWRKVLEDVGGYDEAFSCGAALFEESDFCLRAKGKGHKIYFEPRATLIHLAAPMGGCRIDSLKNYVFSLSRNRIRLVRRHSAFVFWPIALFRLSLTIASFSVRNKRPDVFFEGLRGILAGIREKC